MLSGKKLIFAATTSIDGVDIAKHTASLNMETNELAMGLQRLDSSMCKDYREELRVDTAEFEDFAYGLQAQYK